MEPISYPVATAGPPVLPRHAFAVRVWQATTHVSSGVPLGLLTLVVVLFLGVVSASLAVTVVLAVPVLFALFRCTTTFTAWQRSRFLGCLGIVLAPPADWPKDVGWLTRLAAEARSAATWRQICYHLAAGLLGCAGFVFLAAFWTVGLALSTVWAYLWTLPAHNVFDWDLRGPVVPTLLTLLGLAALVCAPHVALALAWLDTRIARSLLEPSRFDGLNRRVRSLLASRAGLVSATDDERRRLARDLHDGTQQRLTSLAMYLGIARERFTDLPAPAREAIATAHEEAKETLAELRRFARGLHPAILDELGLDAALSGVTDRCPVPVSLRVDLAERPPAAIEAVAYFVVSEALTNVAKHAEATQASVTVGLAEGRLLVRIEDDGRGGAFTAGGSGIRGLGHRVGAVDGTMKIDSPIGEGTRILVELPCAS